MTSLEFDVMRGGLGLALMWTLQSASAFAPRGDLTKPVGLARVISLRWYVSRRLLFARFAVIAGVAYVLDLGTPWALLFISLFLVCEITTRFSEGAGNQSDHLVMVVAVVQLAAIVAWNVHDQWNLGVESALAGSRDATMVWWSIQAIAVVYFTAGLTKLLLTRAAWIQQSPGLLIAAVGRLETAISVVGDDSVKVQRAERLIARLLPHPTIARVLFAGGLACELVAPVGLVDDRIAAAIGVALLAVHYVNGRLLLIPGLTYQVLVATYLVAPVIVS